MTEENTHFSFK